MEESNFDSAPSQAHPETMDFLSREWCDSAVQALHTDRDHEWNQQSAALVLLDSPRENFDDDTTAADSPLLKMDNSLKLNESEYKWLPPWQGSDVKSWIWMQQAMHPEINYSNPFRKKWAQWKVLPFKMTWIKKWFKEIKQKRKEEGRLQRAEVHAALSVAGLAAALAAIAAENSGSADFSDQGRESAVASAAALVASQCAQFAEAMGAKKEQLGSTLESAMISTSAVDILTLTAAATTSLRGAATLKARYEEFMLPIEHHNGFEQDFEKRRSVLSRGMKLRIGTTDGSYKSHSASIILNNESKVIIKATKLSLVKSTMQSVVLDMHVQLYEDSQETTCYRLILSTNSGTMKLDFSDNYKCYKVWSDTLKEMLIVASTSAAVGGIWIGSGRVESDRV